MLPKRSLRVALVSVAAALAVGVPAVLLAQRVPTDTASLPTAPQVGTMDVSGRTLPLYRGTDAVRASVGSRGAVIRLSDGDVRVVLAPGVEADAPLAVRTEDGWQSRVEPLRRIGPAIRIEGELARADAPLELSMRVEGFEPVEGHRLVLVATMVPQPERETTPQRFLKIGVPRSGGAGGERALKVEGLDGDSVGARRAIKVEWSQRLDGKGNDAVRRREAAPAQDAWFGTVGGARVHVVPAEYDPRRNRVTARFDGEGAVQSFELGWMPVPVLERSLRKRPGRTKSE